MKIMVDCVVYIYIEIYELKYKIVMSVVWIIRMTIKIGKWDGRSKYYF